MCFSSDGRLFASASYDHSIRVWESATGDEIFCLQGSWKDTLVPEVFPFLGRERKPVVMVIS